MRSSRHSLFLGLLLCAHASAGEAPLGSPDFVPTPARPAGFLGDSSGVYSGASPKTLSWDYRTGAGISWSMDLPAWGQGSPLVVQGKVVLLAEPDLVLCHDAMTGKELWRQRISPLVAAQVPADKARKLEGEYLALEAMCGEARFAVLEHNYLHYQVESVALSKDTSEKKKRPVRGDDWEGVIPGHRHASFINGHLTDAEQKEMAQRFKTLGEPEVEKMRQRRDALKETILANKWHAGHDYDIPATPYSINATKAEREAFSTRLAALGPYGMFHEAWLGWLGLGFSTPACDGANLYVSYGSGVVACLSLADGKVRWSALLPREDADGKKLVAIGDRDCASPVVGETLLWVMHGGGKGKQTAVFLRALDKATGKMVWEQRLKDCGNHLLSYFIRLRTKDQDLLISNIGPILRARDGMVVADHAINSGISLPTVFGDGLVLTGDRGGDNNPFGQERAMRLVPQADGQVTIQDVWSFRPNKEIPLDQRLKGGCLKVLWYNNQLITSSGQRCDPATGRVIDTVPVARGTESCNPIIAGKYLLSGIASGECTMIDLVTGKVAGTGLVGSTWLRDFLLCRLDLAKVKERLNAGFIVSKYNRMHTATPAAWGERLYLRTMHTLYCIGPSAPR